MASPPPDRTSKHANAGRHDAGRSQLWHLQGRKSRKRAGGDRQKSCKDGRRCAAAGARPRKPPHLCADHHHSALWEQVVDPATWNVSANRFKRRTSVQVSLLVCWLCRFVTPEELDTLSAYLKDKRARLLRSTADPLAGKCKHLILCLKTANSATDLSCVKLSWK